jgi:hypothetical protein
VGCPSLTAAAVRAAVAAAGEDCLVDANPAAADAFKDITGVFHNIGGDAGSDTAVGFDTAPADVEAEVIAP